MQRSLILHTSLPILALHRNRDQVSRPYSSIYAKHQFPHCSPAQFSPWQPTHPFGGSGGNLSPFAGRLLQVGVFFVRPATTKGQILRRRRRTRTGLAPRILLAPGILLDYIKCNGHCLRRKVILPCSQFFVFSPE